MSLTTRLLALLLLHLPGYPTRLEAELLVRLDLNPAVWRVACERGIVRPDREVPFWALASTDPRCLERCGCCVVGGRFVDRFRIVPLSERSARTLAYVRLKAGRFW